MREKGRVQNSEELIDPGCEWDDRDIQIARLIQELHDSQPPSTLLPSVMQEIRLREATWHRRLYRWARAPKVFTITPLKAIPVLLLLMGLFFTSGILFREKAFRPQEPPLIPVVFRLRLPEARSIALIGSFNGWKGEGCEMVLNQEEARWGLTIWLPEGRHEYAFIVDGKRVVTDPGAALNQDDGFGSKSSVLIVKRRDGKNA